MEELSAGYYPITVAEIDLFSGFIAQYLFIIEVQEPAVISDNSDDSAGIEEETIVFEGFQVPDLSEELDTEETELPIAVDVDDVDDAAPSDDVLDEPDDL